MTKSLHSDEYGRLIDWLKSNRSAQGLSMRALAQKMDISHSFIGKVEQQERRLDVIEYVRYCKGLNISPVEGLKIIDGNL